MEIDRNSEKKKYIVLQDLEVYQLARELSRGAWAIYQPMDWQTRKIIGDQFITATDSCGANVAEGYGRFHYLDKIKFYYNARASLVESIEHWLELLLERKIIQQEQFVKLKSLGDTLSVKLNNFISATYQSKNKGQ